VGLPFSLYSTFVIEERHGFNKSTIALFLKDKLLMILLMVVIGTPVFSVMIYVIRVSGEQFYFYVWAFLCLVSILLMTVYPVYIAPLFNDYKKLDAGPVFEAIKSLAERPDVQFPLTQIYEVDGSKRSAHSNAYFFGFFKNKRIVLYDTLLEQVDIPEVQAILGHEMGHWKLWHSLQGFMITQLYTLALFLAFSYVINSRAMYASFGFSAAAQGEDMPIFIGLVIFTQTLWAPVDKFLTFLVNCNSRVNEFAADEFSQQLGYGDQLCTGLIKISVENLGCMVPDSWYSIYHYSHPPLVERLRAIQRLDEKAGKVKKESKKESKSEPSSSDASPAVSPKTRTRAKKAK
jgi:STE24 endopeptidase